MDTHCNCIYIFCAFSYYIKYVEAYSFFVDLYITYLGEGGLIILSKSSQPSTNPREAGQLSLEVDNSLPLCSTFALQKQRKEMTH